MDYGIKDILQLIGSLGLFLFGMKAMSDALMALAGKKMRSVLATMTSNRFLGITTGFFITSIIQSSSATTLMVVSFSNASLLTLAEAISVIMGANIGTTITAWLITILGFKVNMGALALPLVGFGFLFTFSKVEKNRNWGSFIIGFALLFVGLQFLKEALPDIDKNPEILEFLRFYTNMGFWSVLLFLIIGTVLTIAIQSSSATMALTLVMTAKGWIPYEMAAAMVLGENMGTTITANIAAFVANYHAKRTARAHLIFNVIGVVWMLILFYPFLDMINGLCMWLGSETPYINAAAIPLSISLFHTVFNMANTLLLVWFVKPIAKLVKRVVPEKELPQKQMDQPKFLDRRTLKYPETAVASLEKETKYLYENALFEIVCHAMSVHRKDIASGIKVKKIIKASSEVLEANIRELYLTKVKRIYGKIIQYALTAQSKLSLTENQYNRIAEIRIANRKMVEIIRDAGEIQRNITQYLKSDNLHMRKEYNTFRKKISKVLRVLYLFKVDQNIKVHYPKLLQLRKAAKEEIYQGNLRIDNLIREDLISVNMASSLVNDNDHVNDIITKLIEVAELLYIGKDELMLQGEPKALD